MSKLRNWDDRRSLAIALLPQVAVKQAYMPLLDIKKFGFRSKDFSKDFSKDTHLGIWRHGRTILSRLLDETGFPDDHRYH